ncbi:MAG: protein kinase [Acidobacteria bacterium]|nr:protein kinase [Acidobacteriota bacterium]
MSLQIGTRLASYEIIGPLGAGGMGEVYKAHDTRLNRDVAIKVLPDLFSGDPDRLARFEREAQPVAALSHPNVLAIRDFGTAGEISYAVMELLDGETLRERIARGPQPARRVVDIGVPIARALAAAHEKRIVHRDLKPRENRALPDDSIGRLRALAGMRTPRACLCRQARVSVHTKSSAPSADHVRTARSSAVRARVASRTSATDSCRFGA